MVIDCHPSIQPLVEAKLASLIEDAGRFCGSRLASRARIHDEPIKGFKHLRHCPWGMSKRHYMFSV
jgi:hypothetical protein